MDIHTSQTSKDISCFLIPELVVLKIARAL